MTFDVNKEINIYVKELKYTYENPEETNVDADRYLDFGRELIATNNEDLINAISKLSSVLNRRKFDSFYIPYALFMNYTDVTFDLNDPEYTTSFSKEQKEKNLKNTMSILDKNFENKELLDQLYTLVRRGHNIDIIYNPDKLSNMIADIEKTQRITSVVGNMINGK